MTGKILTSLWVACWMTVTVATAQTPYIQQYYPLKKSTPFEVYKVYQDRQGYVWFGTDRGLFRFDGLDYSHFTTADSLPDLHVTAIAEDSLGRLWLGHRSGQLSYREANRFYVFESEEGSATEPVSDILFDRAGVMWFSTYNDGLYYYVQERLYRVDEQEGLPDLYVYDLFEDSQGNIWAGTDGGIGICSRNGREVSVEVLDHEDGLTDLIIRKIGMLGTDTLALATDDAGLLTICLRSRKVAPLAAMPWASGSINDFLVKENQVWLSTPRGGLLLLDRKTRHFKRYAMPAVMAANSLMKDREGNIWIGTRTGLSRTPGDAVELIEDLEPANDPNVLAVTVDHTDRIWFSTSGGLYQRQAGVDGGGVVVQKLTRSQFRDATIISLYTDDEGFVWAGLYGSGLLRIDPKTDAVRHFEHELRNGNILSITGRGDTIVVATLAGASILTREGTDYRVDHYGSAEGLSSDFVYQAFLDSRGRVWFGTDGKGVSMLDKDGFHHLEKGLPSGVVYSIAEDGTGDIWVNAQDNGVYRLNGDTFEVVPDVRLRDNAVQGLTADDDGNVIAIHDYGIDVYNTVARQMRYWGEEAGIRDKRPSLNAVARDRYGRFLIGSSRGIVRFSLDNDHLLTRPKPIIETFSVYNDVLSQHEARFLAHDENNITLRYLGFWYQNPSNLNYQYKLENYDMDWMVTGDRDVTYSRLPPGTYTFRVRASATGAFVPDGEATFSFVVRPPFWTTGPFYILVIGALIIAGYGYIKWRERSLMAAKMILEARVEARTREIQLKNEEIQAQNEEITAQAEEIQGINENLEMLVKQRTAELEKKNKALEEYAFINAHKLRGPVASILGLLNLLAKSEEKDPRLVEHLQRSAEKLDEVVRSITKAIEKADNKYL